MSRVTLTPKQQQAVAAAPAADRQKLIRGFRAQSNIFRMPRASAGKRGEMPDVTRYHFGQTPASSNVIAPRGFGYYDAFAHDPATACTAYSVGPATPITGTTRHSINTRYASGSYDGVSLMIVAPALSSYQAVSFAADAAGALTVSYANSPQLAADPPTTAIPTRCSLRLRNVSPMVTKGGIVRTLRLTTGVQLPSTTAELMSLCELIRSHDRSRTYSGAALADDFQINCTVVDQSKATSFSPFGAVPYSGDMANAIASPTYTPIAIVFEAFTGNPGSILPESGTNTYEFTIRSQFLAHYPQGTMLGNLAKPPPAVGDGMNNLRNNEEKKGSALQPVSEAQAIEAGTNFLTALSEQVPIFDYATQMATGTSMGAQAKALKAALGAPSKLGKR